MYEVRGRSPLKVEHCCTIDTMRGGKERVRGGEKGCAMAVWGMDAPGHGAMAFLLAFREWRPF